MHQHRDVLASGNDRQTVAATIEIYFLTVLEAEVQDQGFF